MLNAKISTLIVVLLAAIVASVYIHSFQLQEASPPQVLAIHTSFSNSLKDKRLLAVQSLVDQGELIASNLQLQSELKTVRDRLSVTPLNELKTLTQNEWNTPVYKLLLAWLQKRESDLLAGSKTGDLNSLIDWWGSTPDLLLGFASTPLSDGSVAAILVAHAKEGMGLQGGQRYDFPMLEESVKSNRPVLGILPWSKSIYLALAYPVASANEQVGVVILGKELGADFVASFSKALPKDDALLLYFQAPKEGQSPRYYASSLSESEKSDLSTAEYQYIAGSSTGDSKQGKIALNDLLEGDVYDVVQRGYTYSASKSTWLKTQSGDIGFYYLRNDSSAHSPIMKLRRNVLISAIFLAIIGIALAFYFIKRSQASVKKLSLALWESINAEKAIDYDALKQHADIRQLVLVLEQLVLKATRDENQKPEGESWNDLMVNLEDESNDLSGQFLKASLPTQQESTDPEAEELRPLYNTYMTKRLENNIDDEMDFEKFVRRVKRNKKQIQNAYQCEDVDFEVIVSAGKVVLKPKIVG